MNKHRLAVMGSIAVVAAAVVAGLWLAGSPSEQRRLRLDDQRVSDLIRLQRGVRSYWNGHRELPTILSDVVDPELLSELPLDPSTDLDYDYRATDRRTFELCAVFERPSPAEEARNFWFHEAGRQCFSFDVTVQETY